MADAGFEELTRALGERYSIQRELGRGGWATVYLAVDRQHKREIAIKVLDPAISASGDSERFLEEIRTAARLQHPNILPLHDSGVAGDSLFYTTPFISGESLQHRLEREGPLPIREALRIGREVAEALAYAHGERVIHRDIKPSNILLSQGHAVVADFGIARVLDPSGRGRTSTGHVLGTPAYMSPEQISGERLDGRTDIYSLAITIYECVAGQPPFVAPNAPSLTYQKLNTEPLPISTFRADAEPELDRVLRRALKPVPADRHVNATELLSDLSALENHGRPEAASGLGSKRSGTSGRPAQRPHRWLPATLAFGAVGLVAIIFAAFGERFSGGAPVAGAHRDWVLLGDFEAVPEHPALARGVREIVRSILEQSSTMTVIPDEQARLGLKAAGFSDTTRLLGGVATSLARRGESRVAVGGVVQRVGDDLTLILRAFDTYRDSLVHTVGPRTVSEEDLAAGATALAIDLRRGVEKRLDALRPGRFTDSRAPVIETRVFDAWRLLDQANRLNSAGYSDSAIQFVRGAIALDPDYARGWAALGTYHLNMGRADSARLALAESLKRPHRLSPVRRLREAALVALIDHGASAAVPIYHEVLALDPNNGGAHEILGLLYSELGNDTLALDHIERAESIYTFGAYPNTISMKVEILGALGRFDEAVTVAATGMSGRLQAGKRSYLGAARENWSAAYEQKQAEIAFEGNDVSTKLWMELDLACILAARGALGDAARLLRRVEIEGEADGARGQAFQAKLLRHVQSLLYGMTGDRAPERQLGTRASDYVAAGFAALAAGDPEKAAVLMERARGGVRDLAAPLGTSLPVLEAWIAAKRGEYREVVRIAGPVARQVQKDLAFPPGRSLAGVLAAGAWEKLGAPDSALGAYERAISPLSRSPRECLARGIVMAHAQARLVELHANADREVDARRHAEAMVLRLDRAEDGAEVLRAGAARAIEPSL